MSEEWRLDPDGPTYVYVQVADYITRRVVAGELRQGARLPAERDLAEDLGVGYLTVRRAMRLLRERGVVESIVGRGTYVVGAPKTSDESTEDQIEDDQ